MPKEEAKMTIADLMKGQRFRVLRVLLSGEIGKRLADMGFTQGVEGRVVRSALFGDPIQVCLMGYNISIRRSEASGVEVETLGHGGRGSGCGHGHRRGWWRNI
jgi:ferrous iron transport protein B